MIDPSKYWGSVACPITNVSKDEAIVRIADIRVARSKLDGGCVLLDLVSHPGDRRRSENFAS